MKKVLLTLAVVFTTLASSAQFMVVSDISQPSVDENLTVGLRKSGDEYDVFGRYNISGGLFVSAQSSTDEFDLDSMDLSIGYSLQVWEKLYIEPSYSKDGEFKIGAAIRF